MVDEAPTTASVAEATEADIAALVRFFWEGWRAAGPEAPGWAGASEEAIAQITDPAAIRARIGGPRRMFISRLDHRVVGFSATREVDEDTVELAGIVVLEGLHGSGVGSALLEIAVESAVAAGGKRVVVRTEATNTKALAFYRKRGFADVGVVVEDVEGTPIELVELVLAL